MDLGHIFPPRFLGWCTRCGVKERADGDNGPCVPRDLSPNAVVVDGQWSRTELADWLEGPGGPEVNPHNREEGEAMIAAICGCLRG